MPACAAADLRPAGARPGGTERAATDRERRPEHRPQPPGRGRGGSGPCGWPGAGTLPGACPSVRGRPRG
eukprot:3423679-Lingulodinium_polyedra.AAC.1